MAKKYELDIEINVNSTLDEQIVALEKLVALKKELKGDLAITSDKDVAAISNIVQAQQKVIVQTESVKKSIQDKVKVDNEQIKITQQLINSSDEEVKGRLRLQQATAEQRRILKQLILDEQAEEGSRAKAVITIAKLKSERDKLNLTTKEGTDALKKINEQIDKNTSFLTASNDVLGKQKDNVGNYPQQLKALQIELAGLEPGTAQFEKLAKEAGELKDKIGDAKDAVKAFSSDSKITQAKSLFGQIGKDIADANFTDAADKAKAFAGIIKSISFAEVVGGIKNLGSALIDVGKALFLNPFVLLATAVAGLAFVFYDLVTSADAGTKALEDNAEALKKVTAATEDLQKSNRDLALQNDIDSGKLNKADGERLKNRNKYNDAYVKLLQEQRTQIKKFNEDRAKERDDDGFKATKGIFERLGGEISVTKKQKEGLKAIEQTFQLELEQLKLQFGLEEKKATINQVGEQAKLNEQANKEKLAAQKQVAKDAADAKSKADAEALKAEQDRLALEKQLIDVKIRNLDDGRFKEIKAEQEALRSRLAIIKGGSVTEIALREQLTLESNIRIAQINEAFDTKEAAEQLARKNNAIKTLANLEITQKEIALLELSDLETTERKQLEEQLLQLKIEALKSDRDIALQNTKLTEDEKFLIIAETEKKILELKKQNSKAAVDDNAKRTAEIKKNLETVTLKIIQESNKQAERKTKRIDDQIAKEQKNVEVQQARAEKGQDNTLEFEQKKLAELEIARNEAAKKEIRRQKIVSYYSLLQGYAKSDSKTALQNTIRDIGFSEAITLAFAEKGGIAGKVKDMTTIQSGMLSRSHGNGRDMLAVISPTEGILNDKRMAKIGGEKGFDKLGALIDSGMLFNGDMFPQVPTFTVKKTESVDQRLVKEIQNLQNIVKNKKETSYQMDEYGNILNREVTNGYVKVLKKIRERPKF